jgi:hypothetical protein
VFDFKFILPNDRRVEEVCEYILENYVDACSISSPPVCSESSASSFRTKKV